MKNEFVPYDIALALKELGFDEPCFGFLMSLVSGFIMIWIIIPQWVGIIPVMV
jgi:hypothetical protein